jgi:hypothetical protein
MQRPTAVALAVLAVLAFAMPAGAIATSPADSATEAATETPVTLTVQLQAPNGSPVGGADVTVTYEDTSKTTTSFSNGNALVDVPEDSTVTVQVDHPEYMINNNVTHDVSQSESLEITMYRRAIAVVRVQNADEDSPNKLEGARVGFEKVGSDREADAGYTGGNGVYQTPDIESGEYRLTVRKRGFEVAETTINVTPPNSGKNVRLTEAAADVSVAVRDDHFSNPQPVQNAQVEIRYQGDPVVSGQTGDSGRRTLLVGVNGQYTVSVTKDGYETATESFYLSESEQSFSMTINRNRSLSIDVVSDRVIAGESSLLRVENAYGDRVQGATIRRSGSEVGTTDENGELQVDVPDAGAYEFVATVDGVSSDPATITGYEPSTATPEPTATETPTESETTNSQSGPLPGFTPVVGVLGLLGAIAVIALRRRQ